LWLRNEGDAAVAEICKAYGAAPRDAGLVCPQPSIAQFNALLFQAAIG
jgi:hypothetical protein